jgi:hypothetical protein
VIDLFTPRKGALRYIPDRCPYVGRLYRNAPRLRTAYGKVGPRPPHWISNTAPSSTPTHMRTVSELRARADELRRMAQTARTADVQDALVALAERFEGLAVTRSAERIADQSEQDTRSD